MPARARVVVAMSGGVDSSTAAALLCQQGFDVVGVTLKLYDASGTAASIGGRCCSPRDIADARGVAAGLGIAHYVLDEVDAFRGHVIDDFVAEYRAGRTPNPCVRCNERIKFGPLLAFARAVGAEALATGHYARLEPRAPEGGVRLRRAVDQDKDQSYFLFGVRMDLLEAVRFPLGDLHKEEVRALARDAGIRTWDKPDSHEICFVPDGDHRAFVERRGGAGPAGVVLDEDGHALGPHEGTHHFTIGQRKGVPGRDGRKRFVIHIEPDTGAVHTGPRERLRRDEIEIADVRWLERVPASGSPCQVQIRHRARPVPARVTAGAGTARVVFDEPVFGASPGQAAVIYDGDVVMGGGWIGSSASGRVA
jgi:tRNA-specific 2-thiouridylase